jgi:uncharacterized protein (TIGR02996 family)
MAVDHVLDRLLAAVIAEPDSDLHRLAYADRLEEAGADDARAEIIRVQCELEPLRAHGHGTGNPHGGDCPTCLRVARLERRERELLSPVCRPLLRDLPEAPHLTWTLLPNDDDYPHLPGVTFRRGFIAEVSLPRAAWQKHGPALVRAAPLTRVRLTDKQPSPYTPTSGPRLWSWCGGVGRPDRHVLRWDMFKRLPGWAGQDRMDYASREEAESALSSAALAWARAAAPVG